MSATVVAVPAIVPERNKQIGFIVAWGFCLLFYFGQYALRSAPGVMVPELTAQFGLTALGVSSLIGFTITPIPPSRSWLAPRSTGSGRNT